MERGSPEPGVPSAVAASPHGEVPASDRDPALGSRRRLLLSVGLLSAVIGLLSSLLHGIQGNALRSLFTGLCGLAFLAILPLIQRSRRPELHAHGLLLLMALGLAASPFVDPDGVPLVVGLVVLPVVSSFLTGATGALVWTLVATGLLALLAGTQEFAPGERTVAWNAAIIAGCMGGAAAWMERSRGRALAAVDRAREHAEREVAARARTESALREREVLFATLFRQAPSILFLADAVSRRILDVNEAFTTVTGWSAEEAIGSTLTELDAWVSLEDRDRLLARMRSGTLLEHVDVRFRTKRGEQVHLLASAEILEIDGAPHVLAQGIDISERKRAQEALARYQRELEARVEESGERLEASLARLHAQERLVAVGTLAAGIAHQINNPVGAISAIAELGLLEDAEADKDDPQALARREAFERIADEARRCGRIVKSVLQFAREEPTAKWPEDLNPTVQRASRLTRDYVTGRGGVLETLTSPEELLVLCSPIEIEQVVVNLVRNAAESGDRGVRVVVETERTPTEAVLRVRDDGRGIPEQERLRVLEPFFTTRLDEGGTGLGLSVVHGIVTDHGGRLSIESAPGAGTCVEVRLPIVTMAPRTTHPAAAATGAAEGTGVTVAPAAESSARSPGRRPA